MACKSSKDKAERSVVPRQGSAHGNDQHCSRCRPFARGERIAEKGLKPQFVAQEIVMRKLVAVVLGQRAAQAAGSGDTTNRQGRRWS